MKLDFDAMEETAIPRFRDGEKTTYAPCLWTGTTAS